MNPIFELKSDHDSILVVLSAMKKLASDILGNKQIDLFRIAQIIDFLRNYIDHCHHAKEEEFLFPSLIESDTPWVVDTIHLLIDEHIIAQGYINAMEANLRSYLAGNSYALERLAGTMLNYITIEENHIKIENQALLPLAERYFSKSKLESISSDFREIQKRKIKGFQHLEYYILLRKLYAETKASQVREFV